MIREPDLSFTRDSGWIVRREGAWEIERKRIASGFSKKQLERYRNYFMTGEEPKTLSDICNACYVFYYPLQNRDGVEYCFRSLFAKACPDTNMRQFRLSEVLSQAMTAFHEEASWLTLNERLDLFHMYFGESYDPNRKFPFLIGDETEYRDFPVTLDWIWYGFLGVLVDWFRVGEQEVPLHAHLLEYFSSMIPYLSGEGLTYDVPDITVEIKDRTERTRIRDLYSKTYRLKKLMKCLTEKSEEIKYLEIKRPFIQKLRKVMDELDPSIHPKELIDNWQRIKKEAANV